MVLKKSPTTHNPQLTTINADHDLDAQQQHLAAQNYDLRITNLARFILSKMKREELRKKSSHSHYKQRTKNYKLLDVGAGNGLFLKFFKDHGFEVSGIELEQENVDNMKKDPQLTGIDIQQGDITRLRGNESYDVVIASDVIEHIKDDTKAVQNLWSYVAPEGMLIITVPAHSYLYGKRDEMWGHYRRYDRGYLLSVVNKALLLTKEESPKGEVVFITHWNTVGFFAYFLYEKILHKPINEKMRYSNTPLSRLVKWVLDMKLKFEEVVGGTPLGLTLIVGVKKNK